MRRLFCYVDESGLDARSQWLIVAVVIVGEGRAALRQFCERAESHSGKGRVKWSWAAHAKRLAYIRAVLDEPALRGALWFEKHAKSKDYLGQTVSTIANALQATGLPDYKATILIDGLPATQESLVGRQLRRMGIHLRKVRGLRDESDALIRLADALCGLARGAAEGNKEMRQLLEQGLKTGAVREVRVKKQGPGY